MYLLLFVYLLLRTVSLGLVLISLHYNNKYFSQSARERKGSLWFMVLEVAVLILPAVGRVS